MGASALQTYNRKRDFRATPEPAGKAAGTRGAGAFVIQKHAARNLHYDFRLEWDGVLRSWAIPKGPSLDPAVKRMAVETEDHPLAYGDFEGVIPAGHYGAGSVILWDRGRWQPVGDARRGFRDGKLKFRLDGDKLKGGFTLVRLRARDGERQKAWLLIKEQDAHARASAEYDVVSEAGESVVRRARRTSRAGAALPPLLSPQLATLVSAPPAGEWHYELKLDGYRMLFRAAGKDVRCFSRNGHDWSSRLPRLIEAVRALKLPPCWLDGEVVALDEEGVPHFQQLQNAFEQGGTAQLHYIVFDLLYLDGEDLRDTSQARRREQLRQLLADRKGALVRFSATLQGDPKKLLAASRAAGFEGLVGKLAAAPYRPGRSRDWIKLKAGLRQEFVIGGFTEPQGSRTGLGSLLLGVHDAAGKLRYVGNVGTGFDERALQSLRAKLDKLERGASPFEGGPAKVGTVKRVVPHWVRATLVAEVSFAGWTTGGHVRQAVFHGLRDDKPAAQIVLEKPKQPDKAAKMQSRTSKPAASTSAAKKAAAKTSLPAGLRVTHPERVIDQESGVTKGDLVTYYARVAALLLPHLEDRPVALLRAPAGVAGQMFFQKHAEARSLPNVDRLPKALDPGHAPLLAIASPLALLSAAQMNVIELHTWNATTRSIEKPDRVILDLDPGSGIGWKQVREAALLVRALLDELQLKSFLKTSGGKGLHVVLPLKPSLGWDEVKQFSGDLVRHLAQVLPQRFVAKSGPRNRVGRIFVDYLRNGRGATTVAAWSARARPGMGISVPLDWSELAGLKALPSWSVAAFEERIEVGNAPWRNYQKSRQGLRQAMRALPKVGATG
jgi:bifunctional non-homologous end joining protein LigD